MEIVFPNKISTNHSEIFNREIRVRHNCYIVEFICSAHDKQTVLFHTLIKKKRNKRTNIESMH